MSYYVSDADLSALRAAPAAPRRRPLYAWRIETADQNAAWRQMFGGVLGHTKADALANARKTYPGHDRYRVTRGHVVRNARKQS